MNSSLAMPLSAEENADIFSVLSAKTAKTADLDQHEIRAWIGLHDQGSENSFTLINGEPASYFDWDSGMYARV